MQSIRLLEELLEIYKVRSESSDLTDEQILRVVDEGIIGQGFIPKGEDLGDRVNAIRAQSFYFLKDISSDIKEHPTTPVYSTFGLVASGL